MVATARTICDEFASPHAAHSLYFGCEPHQPLARGATVDFRTLVSRRGAATGGWCCFNPPATGRTRGCVMHGIAERAAHLFDAE